jgi:hypothetical protein
MDAMTASCPERGRLPGYCVPIVLALAAALGCAGRDVNRVPDQLVGKPWVNADGSPPARDGDTDAVAGLSAVLAGQQPPPQAAGKPLNVLVMSGGGKYGAFTAGILAGWTASGQRPTFDVASGVSSGALIAALAFLGPKYDQQMAQYFTTLQRSDVYAWHIVRGLLARKGVMTAEPLRRIISGAVNEEFLCDLRAAHCEGRRLYVGTSEVLTNRPAVWDIGAIACSGRPDARDLIVNVFTAAASPPGVVVPIEFDVEINGVRYREMHADGGNMLQAFVRTPAGIPPGSNFWVLSAGKYYRAPLEEQPRILNLVAGGVSNSLYALFRADLVKLYALTAVTRSNFRLIALPQDFKVSTSAFAFDPEELVRLFWVGYQMTAGGGNWETTPPDTLPGQAAPPRTGTVFVSP